MSALMSGISYTSSAANARNHEANQSLKRSVQAAFDGIDQSFPAFPFLVDAISSSYCSKIALNFLETNDAKLPWPTSFRCHLGLL